MTAQEHPADVLRRAAALMRERAQAASPGPWHQMCMGSEGCSVINDGRLRERKHVSFSGRKEWKADHADAEFIASWHPLVAEAVAALLEREAALIDARAFPQSDPAAERYPLAVALAYLGEAGTGGTGS